MDHREEIADRLEQSALLFDRAGKHEAALSLVRVAEALRQVPPDIADDLLTRFAELLADRVA